MPRFAITLDVDSDDDDVPATLVALANDANVAFTFVLNAPSDSHRFGNDARVTFDASYDDVRAYLAFYDAPDDAITLA